MDLPQWRGVPRPESVMLDGRYTAIGRLVDVFTPDECARYFAAARYDAT